jgi:Ca2+-binding RTX toxin-like protein
MATRKWGPERLVNTGPAGSQMNSAVAGLTGGGHVVVWEDQSAADTAIRGQRYDALGNRLGGEFLIATNVNSDQLLPSVTGLADGGFYVTWTFDFDSTGNNDIFGAIYNANGGFVRHQPAIFAVGADTDSAVARLGTGAVVAWVDPDATAGDIVFRVFDAVGNAGGLLTANTTTASSQLAPALAASPDASRFAIVWGSTTDGFDFTVRGRVFNANGTEDAAEFAVGDAGSLVTGQPVVAWLSTQRFVVAWNDGLGGPTKAKIFGFNNSAGGVVIPVSGEILVNATGASAHEPQIAALPGGGFVVAWTDGSGVGGDDDNSMIKLQAFDATGGRIGSEIVVNTTTIDDQQKPSISALADGRVVVSWTDESSGNADIRSQIIDPRDGLVTGASGNDTLYGHDAVADEISGFAGNDVLHGLGGADQIHGGEGNDIANGDRGDDTLFGDAGVDTLRGDLGDDELFGGEGNDALAGAAGADLHDGGAGVDTADYLASPTGVTVALDGSLTATGFAVGDTFVSVEVLRGSNAAASGDRLRGDAASNTLYGFAGNDILEGGLGNDNLAGHEGADTLVGGDGGDALTGGIGADALTGGLGNDYFKYIAQNEAGDTVADFSSSAAGNNDTFYLENAAFGGLPVGGLTAAQFQSSTANVAANSSVRFFYETDTRILRFDQDGSAAAFAPVVIATLQAGATMVIGDILLY